MDDEAGLIETDVYTEGQGKDIRGKRGRKKERTPM